MTYWGLCSNLSLMAQSMRIKVRVADLIAKIEESRDQALAEYEKSKEKFGSKTTGQDVLVDIAIHALGNDTRQYGADDIQRTYMGSRHVWAVEVKMPRGFEKVSTPSKPSIQSYNKDIALLKMAAVEELSISVDDRYARYL